MNRPALPRDWRDRYGFHEWKHPGQLIPKLLKGYRFKTVLDIGGGNGVCARPWIEKMGAGLTIVDKWWGYKGIPKPDNLVLMDALEIEERFGKGSFEYVQFTELIEHLERPDGFTLIDRALTVAYREV